MLEDSGGLTMKKSIINIVSALFSKGISILFPFIIRTIMLYKLGNEYIGLSSMFTSLLSVLSLAELGIGYVLTFSMYEPVVENNVVKLCALLNFYRTIYRIIGMLFIGIAIVLTPFIPKLINGTYPHKINIYLLFWIYIINSASSYLFFGYRSSVLVAYRRNDLVFNTQTVINLIMYICQAFVLLLGQGFYSYIIFLPASSILSNYIIYHLSLKKYPCIIPVGVLEKTEKLNIFNQIKYLSVHRIAGTTIISADSLVISAMLGLKPLAIFSNYAYIVTALSGFIDVALVSITSTIGNKLLSSNSREKYKLFLNNTFIENLIVAFCSICMFNIYQPFIKMWVGESNLLPTIEMGLFCVYFFSYKFRSVGQTFKDAAGLWEQDVWKSVIGVILNVILDILFVIIFGSVGVLIATILIMVLIFWPWETKILFQYLFKCSSKLYVIRTIKMILLTILSAIISGYILRFITTNNLLFQCITAFIVSVIIYVGLFYAFFRKLIADSGLFGFLFKKKKNKS